MTAIQFHKQERGQAIVLVVFSMVAIIGMVALAIDGGLVLMERRRAQNAADTSAIAGALAKVANQDWNLAAMNRALTNGYNDDGASNIVEVYSPPVNSCGGNPNPYTGNGEYVQVIIRTTVETYFGGVIGIYDVDSCVEAIAKAKPGEHTPLFYGSAVAATDCHADASIEAQGSARVTVLDSSVFSNSDSDEALVLNWADNLGTEEDLGLRAVGGVDVSHGTYASQISEDQAQIPCPLPEYMLPQYTCDYIYGDFPPAGTLNLNPGVYCINGDFTETPGLTGIGVTFVMLNEGLHWSGNGSMTLVAPDQGITKGLLIYLPPTNSQGIDLVGTADLMIVGTIFAPESHIDIRGDFGSMAVRSQWIGKTVTFDGNTQMTIQYDESVMYEFPEPPAIELTR
jgi:hypothetical protein